jgi:hypothetical protein
MSYQQCLAAIQAAAGRQLSADELDDLVSELERRIQEQERIAGGDALDDIVRRAADDYAAEMAAAAKIEKRNAAINLRRRLEALDTIRTQFEANPALGMESVTVGVNKPVKGARRSAAQEQAQLKNFYLGGLFSDMEKAGLWKVFVSGALDRDIARGLWALNRAEPVAAGISREAEHAARLISKWQEIARQDANAAGAWIKRLEGYITRQSHDIYKIRSAGFDEWRDFVLPKLDLARTMDGETDANTFLRGVWEGLASGVHLKTQSGSPTGFKGPRNIAKRMSAERVLHFKDADNWLDYNERFGTGTLRESLVRSLEHSAQSTGLMRRLGTNPEANFDAIVDELKRGISDPAKRQKFADASNGRLRNQLREVDGSTRIPVSHEGARIAAGVRTLENITKLGAALLSQFSDIPTYGSEMRYQGRSMLSGMLEAINGLRQGRNRREMAEIDGMIGVVMDSMAGEVTQRFNFGDGLPGQASKLQQLFFKFNGMTWWQDSIRASATRAFSHRLALNVGHSFDKLGSDLQRVLRLYGIGEDQWSIIRQAATKEADGRRYVVPETIADLPREAFEALLAKQGIPVTDRRVADLKREIQDQLRTYFVDRAEFAAVTPDQRTRAMILRGTQPGTVDGEAIRFFAQFKSFSFAFAQKVLGREIYGRGADSLWQALRNGNGEMQGLAQVILWMTVFGYGSMVAKDLVKGRTPRDPLSRATWIAAMAQGGGAGIYGDFLFGQANRFGGGIVGTFAGPAAGTGNDLYDLYTRARDGDDSAAQAFRVALNNTPFMNLFYTRIALDYLILYRIQEWLNPGSLRRMERRVQRENGQEFLVRPSTVAR